MRLIMIGAGIFLVIVIAALLFLYSSLDSLVETALEKYGSEITGTEVSVDSVSISLGEGSGTLRGIRVANPDGFSSADALTLSEVRLTLAVDTIQSNPVVIDEVFVNAPRANYERNADGKANLDVIKKNVEQYKGSTESEVSESASGEPRRLLIKRFTFKKGHVRAVLDSDSDRELEVELPEVKMTNVGGQNGGTPDQIGKEVLAAFGQSATRALAKEGIKSVLEQKIEGKAGDAAKKVLDSILK